MKHTNKHVYSCLQRTRSAVYDHVLHTMLTESYDVSEFRDKAGKHVVFHQPCTQMSYHSIGGQSVVFGLSERFRLYRNNVEVSQSVVFGLSERFRLYQSGVEVSKSVVFCL